MLKWAYKVDLLYERGKLLAVKSTETCSDINKHAGRDMKTKGTASRVSQFYQSRRAALGPKKRLEGKLYQKRNLMLKVLGKYLLSCNSQMKAYTEKED